MKTLRGNASAMMVLLVSVIAGMMAFLPSEAAANGAAVTLLILLVLFDVNLFIALTVFIAGKFLLVQDLFSTELIGQKILEGSFAHYFEILINGPITAYWGIEHHLIAGGIVVGFVFGFIIGMLLLMLLSSIRWYFKRSAYVHELLVSRNFFLRFILWFLTSSDEKHYQRYLSGNTGNPFRALGIILFAVLAIGVQGAAVFFKEFGGVRLVESKIEEYHGATVDIDNIVINLFASSITIESLALTDPKDLSKNMVQAETILVDINLLALLQKHYVIDRLIVHDVIQGSQRRTQGMLTRDIKAQETASTTTAQQATDNDQALPGVSDYFSSTDGLLNNFSGIKDWFANKQTPESDSAIRVTQKQVESTIKLKKADNLVHAKPIEIRYLQIKPIGTAFVKNETFNVIAYNVLPLEKKIIKHTQVLLSSNQEKLKGDINLKPHESGRADSKAHITYTGLAVNDIKDQIKLPEGTYLQGGTIDVLISGEWLGGIDELYLPATITLHHAELTTKDLGKFKLDDFSISLIIKGSVSKPQFQIDNEKLTTSLIEAASKNLGDIAADKVKGKIQEEVSDALNKVLPGQSTEGDSSNPLTDIIKDVIPGSTSDKPVQEKQDKKTDSLKDAGEQLLKGLFD